VIRRLATIAACAVGALIPVTSAQAATPLSWAPCADPGLAQAHLECATLQVPLDHARPTGPTIAIALSRLRHTVPGSRYQGVVLVNPGGPGGSGLGLAVLGNFVPGGVGGAYDWIGFDPRGVGASTSISCIPSYFDYDRPYYVPVTHELEQTWLGRAQSYADACAANAPPGLLDHMKTVDAVADMESIREALGVNRINYYGFSYGTYLGQVYATLHPGRVRRMVLDSNVDPRKVWYAANLDQDVAFDRDIDIWFGWIARYDSVYHLGKTEKAVRTLFYDVEQQLRRVPAGGLVGPDEWTDAFLLAGYVQFLWPDLASAFAGWVHDHDAATLRAYYEAAVGTGDDNGYAVYSAVQCTDVQWPTRFSTWRTDNWRIYKHAPFVTWGNAWFNAPCLFWPAKAGRPANVDGSKVPGVLLIDETLDAATPFPGSLEVRRRFPRSSLIAEPGGTSHANSLAGNACVDDQIAAYLANGTLPRRKAGNGPDATCAPLPQPVPTAPAAQRKGPAAAAALTRLRLLAFRR
jgi:pimeloyl-ACP methyl ester carboxylesterase